MRTAGLAGVCRRRKVHTTRRDEGAAVSEDLVKRVFSADQPDRLWVAGSTYLPTWQGFLYLAVVLDAFSRRIVGWSMANHLRAELVLAALEMALWRWPSGTVGQAPVWSTIRTTAPSTPAWPSAAAATRRASPSRWARLATVTTTRLLRASSPPFTLALRGWLFVHLLR